MLINSGLTSVNEQHVAGQTVALRVCLGEVSGLIMWPRLNRELLSLFFAFYLPEIS